MSEQKPILTFHVAVPTTASPAGVYDLLADVNAHKVWAGEQAKHKAFKLLSLDAPRGQAVVGDRFSSSGASSAAASFVDTSVVVEAEPGHRFGFDTQSRLDRARRPTWHVRFSHRYALAASGTGTVIDYTCEVRPQNYKPYWLQPGMRLMTPFMVQRMIRSNLKNLARLAEAAAPAQKNAHSEA
ncbi:MAG TPA: SRPBCC family protein [Actinomycetota bacterium]|nr:SRPBCC family protein [Actinomycetota bacterium]